LLRRSVNRIITRELAWQVNCFISYLSRNVDTYTGHADWKTTMKLKLCCAICLWVLAIAQGSLTQAQEKLEKILVGVAGLSGALAHAFIPKDAGLYEKYGLDVDLVFFQGGTQAIQATLSGGLQLAVTAGPEIIHARASGSDMTMIAGYMNTMPIQHRRGQKHHRVRAIKRHQNGD
jgi:hypothetical protein